MIQTFTITMVSILVIFQGVYESGGFANVYNRNKDNGKYDATISRNLKTIIRIDILIFKHIQEIFRHIFLFLLIKSQYNILALFNLYNESTHFLSHQQSLLMHTRSSLSYHSIFINTNT